MSNSCRKCREAINPVFHTVIRCSWCKQLLHVHCTSLENGENLRKLGSSKDSWKCEFCVEEMITEYDTNMEPRAMTEELRELQVLRQKVIDIQFNMKILDDVHRIDKRMSDIEKKLDSCVEESRQLCSDKINDFNPVIGTISDDVEVLKAKGEENNNNVSKALGEILILQKELIDIKLVMKKLEEVDRIEKSISDKIQNLNQVLGSLSDDVRNIKKENELLTTNCKDLYSKLSDNESERKDEFNRTKPSQ